MSIREYYFQRFLFNIPARVKNLMPLVRWLLRCNISSNQTLRTILANFEFWNHLLGILSLEAVKLPLGAVILSLGMVKSYIRAVTLSLGAMTSLLRAVMLSLGAVTSTLRAVMFPLGAMKSPLRAVMLYLWALKSSPYSGDISTLSGEIIAL